jgi:hypothetical protein
LNITVGTVGTWYEIYYGIDFGWHFFWRAIEYWVDGDLYEFINLKSSATIGIATPATNFHHCSDGEGDEET